MHRRTLIIGGAASALTAMAHAAEPSANPRVIVKTELGSFTVEIYPGQAPITSKNFLAYVDGGYLNGSSVYRIVAARNQSDAVTYKIAVVQWGTDPAHPNDTPFPPIPHEDTRATGLKHVNGTLSMARLGPGTASSAFFICVGDQPELDFGGHRNPDGLGFAAFGHVVAGMDVVMAIYGRAEDEALLRHPIPISTVARLS